MVAARRVVSALARMRAAVIARRARSRELSEERRVATIWFLSVRRVGATLRAARGKADLSFPGDRSGSRRISPTRSLPVPAGRLLSLYEVVAEQQLGGLIESHLLPCGRDGADVDRHQGFEIVIGSQVQRLSPFID